MRHFHFKDGHMHCEDVALKTIAERVGTPVYVYSAATLTRHFKAFQDGIGDIDALIAFAVKANSNLAVLALLGRLGAGADVVSGGELARALAAGISPDKIVFSGVGKRADEMRAALNAGIFQFNVESIPELYRLSACAAQLGKTANIAFRINPDIAAGGHEKISTGKAENKFGIDIKTAQAAYAEAANLPGINIAGIDMHIGSQIVALEPFENAAKKGLDLIKSLRAAGHKIRTFDIGGGLGIPYRAGNDVPPTPIEYGQLMAKLTREANVKMVFEPGRLIAGNSGILLTKTEYVKIGEARNFLILDAAMNDLIRPAMYDAFHDIEAVDQKPDGHETVTYDVVGPVCETGDTFTRGRDLPQMQEGDLLAIHSAGAYGAVLASQYNTRPLVPEVLVSEDRFDIIRERPSVDDILAMDSIPDWI